MLRQRLLTDVHLSDWSFIVNFSLSCESQKWIPSIKEKWFVAKTTAEPHVQSFTTKFIEVYETSKTAATPHVIKTYEVVDSYYQV